MDNTSVRSTEDAGSHQRWVGTVRGVGNRKSRKSEMAQKSENKIPATE